MSGLEYRLREFIRPEDGRSLIVDASAGLALGALPGLEDFAAGVGLLSGAVDGLVCSPGQLRRLTAGPRHDAGLLVRADWTNALRSSEFVIPPASVQYIPLLSPQDAADLGAVGLVGTILLGYEEEIEAACVRQAVQWAMAGQAAGMPLVVEIQATGPRVALPDKAIELGASYALEAGADVIAISYPGQQSLATLGEFVNVPWLVKPTSLESAAAESAEAIRAGAAGLWLDHRVFEAARPAAWAGELSNQLHQVAAA